MDQVRQGQHGGFVQLSHGEEIPLKRMQPGDWLIYYSSRLSVQNKEKCQSFTAAAQISDAEVYSVFLPEGYVLFRRNARFIPCCNASVVPLIEQLSFIDNKQHWGYPFRNGHFEISFEDFQIIAKAMRAEFSDLT